MIAIAGQTVVSIPETITEVIHGLDPMNHR